MRYLRSRRCAGLGAVCRGVLVERPRAGALDLTRQNRCDLNMLRRIEVLVSPDGARLYVLCQQSGEVRVLDATTYAVDQEHRGGTRAARVFAFA